MSTPDDDTDPTGMRALLRGLPEPGPMPDDLIVRIQSSLADLRPPEDSTGDEGGLRAVSRGTDDSSPHRPSWWTRNGPRLAIAAAVLVGGGAVASDQLGLLGSGGDASSSGSAADSSSGARTVDPSAEGPARTESAPSAGRDTGGSPAEGPVRPGQVVVTMSGRAYTAAGLAGEIDREVSAAPTAPLTAESPGIGPIGTEIGVRSCLAALGLPPDAATRVDLALVDATPAAVLVVTREGGRTAYAVGRSCTVGNPALITGPIELP